MSLRMLDDRVLVRTSDPTAQSEGGIYIPDNAQEKPTRGVVLSVGPGKLLDTGKRAEMAVSEGDKVIFLPYGGTSVDYMEEELTILKQDEILAVYSSEDVP